MLKFKVEVTNEPFCFLSSVGGQKTFSIKGIIDHNFKRGMDDKGEWGSDENGNPTGKDRATFAQINLKVSPAEEALLNKIKVNGKETYGLAPGARIEVEGELGVRIYEDSKGESQGQITLNNAKLLGPADHNTAYKFQLCMTSDVPEVEYQDFRKDKGPKTKPAKGNGKTQKQTTSSSEEDLVA